MMRDELIKKVWNDCESLVIDTEVAYGVEEAVEWCERHATLAELPAGLESQFGAYGKELSRFIREYDSYSFIGWKVFARKGGWTFTGTACNMSTGANDEAELQNYLHDKAAKFGHYGKFDELNIVEIEKW